MSDLKTSVILDMSGNLSARAKSMGRALDGMGKRGTRSLGSLRRSAALAGRGLDALGNRYAALAGGAGAVATGRMLLSHQQRMTYLGIQANASAERIHKLSNSIYEIAQAPDIRVNPDQITAAVEQIVEKTGDLEFAEANIRNIGLAIRATNAQGSDIGGIMAEFQKMDIKDADVVLKALDTLNVQGKEGAFTLRDLAALGPRVMTAYTSLGRTGPMAIREMGAALQMIRMGTGSSEMAATAFEATLRTLSDPTKLKKLQGAGINVFENGVMRPINQLMAEIVEKSGGDKVKLGTIFDAEAIRAFNQAASEFKRTGSLESLDRFMSVQADGTTTIHDSARAAETAAASLENLFTAWKKFADHNLTAPIQGAANVLNALGSDGADTMMNVLGYGAAGVGAMVLGRKAYKGGRGLMNMFRGKGGAAGAMGGLGGMPLPLPVYVVNDKMSLMPGEMGGGANVPGSKSRKAGRSLAKRGGRLARNSRFMGRAGGALAMAGAGYDLYNTWSDDLASTSEKVEATGGAVGSGLGGWGGAAAGAAIGTMILPGIGTAIGAGLGGIVGSMGGEWAGSGIGSLFSGLFDDGTGTRKAELDKALNGTAEPSKAKLEISVSDERVRVRSVNNQGFDEVNVDSGLYMPGVGS